MKSTLLLFAGGFLLASTGVAAIRFVNLDNPTPAPPYTNWSMAALTIQDAVDASGAGDLVLVTNGIYQAGGRVVAGALSNRVAIANALVVQSVNGPEVTVIRGFQVPGSQTGDRAIRCAYLTNGAALIGFTLSNGATRSAGDLVLEQSGGGIWCASSSALVSNCVLTGNSAAYYAGGAFSGTLNDCTISSNNAVSGGGACSNTLTHCVLLANFANSGAGAFASLLTNCNLTNNFAFLGGGAHSSILNGCALSGNAASSFGGGSHSSTLSNCLLVANSAYYGGGAYSSVVNDSIFQANVGSSFGGASYSGTLNRCKLLANYASSGGGAYLGTLNNCTLKSNTATSNGGGASSSTINGSELIANMAASGGGAYSSTLNACTLTGNSASTLGGGAFSSTLKNCIDFYNRAPLGPNYSGGGLDFCCTTPLPTTGAGNLDAEPGLASSSHLSAASSCRAAGSPANAPGLDIDGESWLNPPSIGCDEFRPGTAIGSLSLNVLAAYTDVAVGFTVSLSAEIEGETTVSRWDFGDGTSAVNQPYSDHAWLAPGDYAVALSAYNDSNPGGISATSIIHVLAQPIHYVSLTGPGGPAPYTSWATAATNIQDAVEAATVTGALVLASNGIYAVGGRVVSGTLSNRVAVTTPLVVRSLNGPLVTAIQGYQMPGVQNGSNAVRCAYLADGASLFGFTLANGATRTNGDSILDQSGGGVWCASASTSVSNCIIVSNSAAFAGGGAYYGALNNCSLLFNKGTNGGGAYLSTLMGCTIATNSASQGGGANAATLTKCVLTGNSASVYGGGAYSSTLNQCTMNANSAVIGGGTYSGVANSCVLNGNSASSSGGGAYSTALNNCTLANNSATSFGGGASFSTLKNTIVYYNSSPSGPNYFSSTLDYCCALPLPDTGPDNFSFDPLFVDLVGGDLHLHTNSPCINAGRNAYVATARDLDGNPRIANGTVDAGAYESQPPVRLQFVSWLQQHGLATDGSADFADPDGDGLNNWQEFLAGTDPNDSASAFRIVNAVKGHGGFTITWQSVPDRAYFVQRSSTPGPQASFVTLTTNIPGQPVTTSFLDRTAPGSASYYRVGTLDVTQLSVGSIISYAWLQQHGLPNDGSADFTDPDQDGMNNWQEWKAGTDPNDAASVLRLLPPSLSGFRVTLAWTSVTNRFYLLERATDLGGPSAFSVVRSDIVGLFGTTTYMDTNGMGSTHLFYRVRVQE